VSRLYAVPLGVLGLVLVTALERLESYTSVRGDPCAILVTYLAFRFDMMGGIFSAMLLGFFLDTFSGAPTGLHMMSLQLLFVVLRISANAFQLDPGVRLLPVAVAAAWLHATLVTLMVGIFGEGTLQFAGLWKSSAPSLLFNAVLGLVLLYAVDRLAQRVMPDSEHMFIVR